MPATEPAQPSSTQPAASQATPDVQQTEAAAADKPQSKKNRSPPGENDDVILLSSEHGSSSADESPDDASTAAEPRRIKTEPFSMNDVDNTTGGTETTNSAPSGPPTSTQGNTAPNQADTQSQQSADSDADDEGSVGGNDPDPSSTDDEMAARPPQQQPRADRANHRVEHEGTVDSDSDSHSASESDAGAPDNDRQEARTQHGTVTPATAPATAAAPELTKETETFVSALKRVHQLIEDLTYGVLRGSIAVDQETVQKSMTTLSDIATETASAITATPTKKAVPLLPDVVDQLYDLLPAQTNQSRLTDAPSEAPAGRSDANATGSARRASPTPAVSQPQAATSTKTAAIDVSQARPADSMVTRAPTVPPTVPRGTSQRNRDIMHAQIERARPSTSHAVLTSPTPSDAKLPSLKWLSWRAMANNNVFMRSCRLVTAIKRRPPLSSESAEDAMHILRLIDRFTHRTADGRLYGPYTVPHRSPFPTGYTTKTSWILI